MGSSSRSAALISLIASSLFFFIIFFQLPLFRVPCRIGICTSPMEVVSSQLIATKTCPPFFVKALLYPGAIAHAFINNQNIPSFDKLLKLYNLNHFKKGLTAIELQCLEFLHLAAAWTMACHLRVAVVCCIPAEQVPGSDHSDLNVILAGSCLSVAGALLGIVRPGRMSLIGTLVIIWGFLKQRMLLRKSATTSFSMYPAISIALLCAWLSIRKDVRTVIRCFKSRKAKNL